MKLQSKNLIKSYRGRRVVNKVNIGLEEGEIVGLLGPNGAGKTTTFYMIMGFIGPDSGTIHFDGKDITSRSMHQRAQLGIGYLPQEPSIFRGLKVKENLMGVLEILVRDRKERQERFDKLVKEFKLEPLLDQYGAKLSGGERRRVEIARSLTSEPKFLLLDEPFTGIDPITREELQEMILRLQKKKIGILITDHNVRETLQITDRAYLMFDGEIIISGNAEELTRNKIAKKLYLGEKFTL
ncbi:LPS export ABC transporter ATP-binding protein [candidate division WOR-3 bacterium]|nr:LPS export ABC transporter ATP-binding protein [candidate division WOR-3 bacterium]MCK4528360.1 LPS export ABC transporter ATP-binding protein [candidate division WOR-3 bacterium]